MESLFVLFIFCNPTDNLDIGVDGSVFMMVDFGEASCSLSLAVLATLVMQSGVRKLTYIMMVELHNLHVEYGHCTVKQTYENVLYGIKVTNGLGVVWPSLI
jgi:hypothetical protein